MDSICGEQHHHHHKNIHNKKFLREINIPPRRFLSRRITMPIDSDHFMDSPKMEEILFHKFLPCNNIDEEDDDDDDDDPYSSEQFRMYEFKVRKCTRSRSHDWTDCPFAHEGEKARRRDPRRYHYLGTVCPEFRRGHCSRGDNCEFAHGVFECWLHPSRYRTEACKDGKNCKRKICFFAHTPRQLRLLPIENLSSPMNSPPFAGKKNGNIEPCCVYCHSLIASPKSTPRARFSPVSRYKDDQVSGGIRYEDEMMELMNSLETMQLNYEPAVCDPREVNYMNFNGEDHNQVFSSPSSGANKYVGGVDLPNKNLVVESENNLTEPDLGWVNDLLV